MLKISLGMMLSGTEIVHVKSYIQSPVPEKENDSFSNLKNLSIFNWASYKTLRHVQNINCFPRM